MLLPGCSLTEVSSHVLLLGAAGGHTAQTTSTSPTRPSPRSVLDGACMWPGHAQSRADPRCRRMQTVGPNDPEQIHLALGAAGEMYVSWVTGDYVIQSTPPVTPTTGLKTQVRVSWVQGIVAWAACLAPAHGHAALHAGQVRAAAGEAGPAGDGRGCLLHNEQHRVRAAPQARPGRGSHAWPLTDGACPHIGTPTSPTTTTC